MGSLCYNYGVTKLVSLSSANILILLVASILIYICWPLSPLAGSVSGWPLVITPSYLCMLLIHTSGWDSVLIYPPVGIGLPCVLLEVYL